MAKGTTKAAPAPARNAARQTQTDKAPATRAASKSEMVVSEDLSKLMDQDSGKGVSTASEDNVVPLIYVLQSQSPQVLKQKQEYIKGAEAGMFWFRGTKDILDGELDGLIVVPVHFGKKWMEWQPNRGGLAGIHATRPEDAVLKTDPKPPHKQYWERPNGNTTNEVRDHVVIVIDEERGPSAMVLPFTGSNHTSSRSWMGLMNRARIPGTDKKAPSFAYQYRVRTVPKTNDQGDWFGMVVDHAGVDGEPLPLQDIEIYKMARQLHADFESGARRADVAEDIGADNSASGTEDDDKI